MEKSLYLPSLFGGVAQLARAPAWHAGGRGFESHPLHFGKLLGKFQGVFFYLPTNNVSGGKPPFVPDFFGCIDKNLFVF